MPSNTESEGGGFPNTCQLIGEAEALRHFASHTGATQSQQHIKPLHWYAACRLVIEGGFRPEDLTPRPPLRAVQRRGEWHLELDPAVASGGERTVLGGLKTKNVDVVVIKEGIGPVLAVSCKGMTGAFRNLTNRMEETIGECTNLHITYPALVFGYLFVIRAYDGQSVGTAKALAANDIALQADGNPVESIFRFHTALRELTGRRGIRNDVSRYEAVSLSLVHPGGNDSGKVLKSFPPADSPLRIEFFFQTLYSRYDERFVFSAPDLKSVTRRIEWSAKSSLFLTGTYPSELGYEPRLAGFD